MIVLLNPHSTWAAAKPLPMSLLALAAQLEGQYRWKIVDGNLSSDPVAEIAAINRETPVELLAVTVMPGPQFLEAVAHTRQLRTLLPRVPIVWGGYFPSQHADVCLESGLVDYCVRGQGEETFLELIQLLFKGGCAESIAGLTWRENGVVRQNPDRSLLDLDGLPEWPYQHLPMQRYLHNTFLGNRVADHHSSFGCPYGCNFCGVVEMAHRRWVAESPGRVESAVARLHRDYQIDALQFHDMDFFIHEARAREIADRIQRFGLNWWALGRVDELLRYSSDSWQSLKASGLKMIFCGAESGSEVALSKMKKGGRAKTHKTIELALLMREYGIIPEFSFVVGLPPDPEEDILRTIEFTRQLKQSSPEVELIFYRYTPVPLAGTLSQAAGEAGFRFPATLEEWTEPVWRDLALRRQRSAPWLSERFGRLVSDYETVVNAYYPTRTLPELKGVKRALLRALGSWRYRIRFYNYPWELRVFHRLVGYRRPETTGF